MEIINFTNLKTTNFFHTGIYLIIVAGHFYVGSSQNIEKRMLEHRRALIKNNGDNQKFINCVNKYGINNCYYRILEECDETQLLNREEYWINLLQADLNINKYPTQNIGNRFSVKQTKKPIYQYDLEGNFIAEYESSKEASEKTGIYRRSISLAASSNSKFKSAGNFQWSYIKINKLSPYTNNSALAKIKSVYIFDVLTGIEQKFDSIIKAAKSITNNTSTIEVLSATISSCCKIGGFIQQHYLARYENEKYKLPTRNSIIYNAQLNEFYDNHKIAQQKLNISLHKIKNKCKDESDTSLHYLNVVARVKFRESGKLHLLDNPNPSSVEIQ